MTSLPPEVIARLRCPVCRRAVSDREGAVTCLDGHIIPFEGGVLDCLGGAADAQTARTFESFGYEWLSFHRIKPEDEIVWKKWFADVPFQELKGRVALDAGCGRGQFSRFSAPSLGAVVALDGSRSVEIAARHLADLPNVAVVRADLRSAPFAEGSFDFIFCMGVLHHLPDPYEGFTALIRLLAPGGLLLFYIYSSVETPGLRSAGLRAAAGIRRVSVRTPRALLKAICAPLALFLYLGIVLPGWVGERLGWRPLAALPLETFRGVHPRSLWHGTYDLLSAPLEKRYSRAEIEGWLGSAGLTIRALRDDAGWIVLASKPIAGPRSW